MIRLSSIHLGEICLQEYFPAAEMTPSRLAKAIGSDAQQISGIVRARRLIENGKAFWSTRYF